MIEAFNLRGEFELALNKLLNNATQQPSQLIQIFDYDLELLAPKKCVDLLQDFFLKSRKNKMFAVLYDDQKMRKDMPQLFNSLINFSHICEFYVLQRNRNQIDDAFILVENRDLLIRPNRNIYHGNLYINEPELVGAYSKRYEELIESSKRVSLFTLGL